MRHVNLVLGAFQGYAVLVSGLSRLPQGTRHKVWAKRQLTMRPCRGERLFAPTVLAGW